MSNIEVKNGDQVVIGATTTTVNTVVVSQPTTSTTIKGVVGGGGDAHFVFNQEIAKSSWEVQHNLNKKPSVMIVDSGDNYIQAEVRYIDNNNLTINFGYATTGKAYLN